MVNCAVAFGGDQVDEPGRWECKSATRLSARLDRYKRSAAGKERYQSILLLQCFSTDLLYKKSIIMFKLVVLSALLAVVAAKPSGILAGAPLAYAAPAPVIAKTVTYAAEPVVAGYSSTIIKPALEAAPIVKTALISEPGHVEVREPVVAKVGSIVQSVPTAVSHQSSTIVHSKANFVTPVVAPAIKTYTAPVLKTYSAPVIASQHLAVSPVLKAYAGAPLINSYGTPLAYSGYSAPLTYAAGAPILKTFGSPLTYGAPIAHGW